MEINKKQVEYVGDRIDQINSKLVLENKRIKAIYTFMQNIKKEVDNFSKLLGKWTKEAIKAFSPSEISDEWSYKFSQKILGGSEEYVGLLSTFSQALEFEVLEPMKVFQGQYETRNKLLVKEGNKILDNLSSQRNKLRKLKERFAKDCKNYSDSSTEDQAKNRLRSMLESKEEYRLFVNSINQFLEKNEAEYASKLDNVCIGEENRLDFLKRIITTFCSISEGMGKESALFSDKMKTIADSIHTGFDLTKFIPPQKKISNYLFYRCEYEEIEPSLKEGVLKNGSDKGSHEDYLIDDSEEEFIKCSLEKMINNSILDPLEKERMRILLKSLDGRKCLSMYMSIQNRKIEISNKECFQLISDYSNHIIKRCIQKKELDPAMLNAVLTLGSNLIYVHSEIDYNHKDRKYLRDAIAGHSCWQSKEVWRSIIELRIESSIAQVHNISLMKKSKLEPQKKGFVKQLIGAGAKLIGKDKKDTEKLKIEAQEEASKKSAAFSELNSVGLEMALLQVDSALSLNLFLHFSLEFNVEPDKLYQLLCDFECAQPLPRDEDPRITEWIRYSLNKRDKERRRYGYSKASMILGMSLKFFSDPKTLANILLVNKEWGEIFKSKIYKIVLRYCKNTARVLLWKNLIFSNGLNELYMKLKEQSMEDFQKNNKSIDDVIRLDVLRSFHIYTEKDQIPIMNILRCYAMLNPEVEYCQGMNCIAGMLYLIYKDEGVAFNMFSTLIANHNLSYLFKKDVPMLRMYFYQMNRLIALYLPRLHLHMFQEGINSTYFCSSWFLTAFTYILQHCTDPHIPCLQWCWESSPCTKRIHK